MDDLYEILRSSWGTLPFLHALTVIGIVAVMAAGAFLLDRAPSRASWLRDETGQAWVPALLGALTVAVIILLIVVFS